MTHSSVALFRRVLFFSVVVFTRVPVSTVAPRGKPEDPTQKHSEQTPETTDGPEKTNLPFSIMMELSFQSMKVAHQAREAVSE